MKLICITLLLANMSLAVWYQYPRLVDELGLWDVLPASLIVNNEPSRPSNTQQIEDESGVARLWLLSERESVSDTTVAESKQTPAVSVSEALVSVDQMASVMPVLEADDTGESDQAGSEVLADNNPVDLSDNLQDPNDTGRTEPAEPVCIAYGPFLERQLVMDLLERAQALESISRVDRREERTGASSYWVYFPPFATRQAALAKLRVLRQQNIDSFIFTDGALAGGISVGLFSTMQRAEIKQTAMKKRGHSVEISELQRIQETFWLITEEGTPVFSWLDEIQTKNLSKESAKCIAQMI